MSAHAWDYLIVTASNDDQAHAYETQLFRRRDHGLLSAFRHVLVVGDPEGRRIGSGGSTALCLLTVLGLESQSGSASSTINAVETLSRLRILILHAGGDSRRLPAYGPCGKIFVPVPGNIESPLGCSLFDRLLPPFLRLPAGLPGRGQVVVAAGDALVDFDPSPVRLDLPGMIALTCPASVEAASKHGVFCPDGNGRVRLYLQKPSPARQRELGALNTNNEALLDIGIMSFDAACAGAMLNAFEVAPSTSTSTAAGTLTLDWSPRSRDLLWQHGADFYREICCALGTETTLDHYEDQCRTSGSSWDTPTLERVFHCLSPQPFHLQQVPYCRFLHFGTTAQLLTSGAELRSRDFPGSPEQSPLVLNSRVEGQGKITGSPSWIEGCHIAAPFTLAGNNVVAGVDIEEAVALPEGLCVDTLSGRSREGAPVHFARIYGVRDTFKDAFSRNATYCGKPLAQWLVECGLSLKDVWPDSVAEGDRSLWNARVFPASASKHGWRDWLWLAQPSNATPEKHEAFRSADRYSAAEIALLADPEAFFKRRDQLRDKSPA